LLTDGAHRAVALADLQPALVGKESAEASAQRVVALARVAGGADNATVLLAREATIHGTPADPTQAPRSVRVPGVMLLIALAFFVIASISVAIWWLSDSHLYLGTNSAGTVSLFAGAPQSIYGLPLHVTRKTYTVTANSLPTSVQHDLDHGLQVSSQIAADDFLREQIQH
jgi:hypothetical protein